MVLRGIVWFRIVLRWGIKACLYLQTFFDYSDAVAFGWMKIAKLARCWTSSGALWCKELLLEQQTKKHSVDLVYIKISSQPSISWIKTLMNLLCSWAPFPRQNCDHFHFHLKIEDNPFERISCPICIISNWPFSLPLLNKTSSIHFHLHIHFLGQNCHHFHFHLKIIPFISCPICIISNWSFLSLLPNETSSGHFHRSEPHALFSPNKISWSIST